MTKSAPFVTIEGVDGAGKSSHIPTVVAALEKAGFSVLTTREPGGTELGEILRKEILNTPMEITTEVLLAFASRAEHVARTIRPQLENGLAVVSDRFTDSTYAYQGAGGGFPVAAIGMLETLVHGDIQPDITLLFDLPVEESLRRLGGTGKDPDKFERQNEEQFQRIRDGYLARHRSQPDRVVVIDANQPIEAVARQVESVMAAFAQTFTVDRDVVPSAPRQRSTRP